MQDFLHQPLHNLRVLDLGCLEGMYALEFAQHGAQVLGIEGRLANIEKARFAKRVLGFSNCDFVQDDVRNLSLAKYGDFDVVLCCGILYHLDAPDV
ncbi:MAG: methyltransferase domain-containing protein, partial [Deltaproteobacteria bacterium]|nr:methyltransferase domain-containing protein [Deltaproteobacteria bacterium]